MTEQHEPQSSSQAGPQAGQTRTEEPPTGGPQAGSQAGPRVSGADIRDLSRLRRSSQDRKLAGVAGGLGRHLDIDPTVVRVTLVVLTLFGGAGLILYVALWLFVPLDTSRRATIGLSPELQSVVVIGALAVAAAVFLGNTFSNQGWGIGFPLVIVMVVTAGVYLAIRDRRDLRDRAMSGAPGSSPSSSTAYPPPPEGTTMTTTSTEPVGAPPAGHDGPPAPPAWMPPPPAAYTPPPPKPRRPGPVLFWPTLALIAIALGTLGVIDASSSVAPSAYLALAVAVIGAVLVVGAFVGRAGGLIALGLLTSFAMIVSTGVDAATGGDTASRTLRAAPTSAAAVDAEYRVPNGSLEVDLRGVTDPANLAGRITVVRLGVGDIVVHVPRTIAVHVAADLKYAGHIDVGNQIREGVKPTLDTTLPASAPAEGNPTFELVVKARAGSISVEQD